MHGLGQSNYEKMHYNIVMHQSTIIYLTRNSALGLPEDVVFLQMPIKIGSERYFNGTLTSSTTSLKTESNISLLIIIGSRLSINISSTAFLPTIS